MRLPPDQYKLLCRMVLARDNYKCRMCGRRNGLHVHHIIFRSRGGEDTLDNLITLCFEDHELVHNGSLVMNGDANQKVDVVSADGFSVMKQI